MTRMFERAIREISALPADVQDEVGAMLLRWRKLKADLDEARADIDQGRGITLTAEKIIREARAKHAGG